MKPPIITLLTDFGVRDAYVGSMKGVILSLCPQAQLVDLSHEVPPQAIGAGAFLLKSAIPCFPKETIHLAVVDPGVGSSRKAIAFKSHGHFFVGPDNGLFPAALGEWEIEKAVELTEKKFHLQNPSSTFHGRDLFAPVAAHLARGVPFSKLGQKLNRWAQGEIPKPRQTRTGYAGQVLWIDHFGNLITNFEKRHLSRGSRLKVGQTTIHHYGSHYAAVKPGEPLALMGSSGYWEISVNGGFASQKLGIHLGAPVLCFGPRIVDHF
jgi:S-adenosylmethionine hydrolase